MEKPGNDRSSKYRSWPQRQKVFIFFTAALLLVAGSLVAYRLISGRSLGLKSFARETVHSAEDMLKALSRRQNVVTNNQGEYTNIIFLHHSVGHNLIAQGHVRRLFTQAGYDFWDHDYNTIGLTAPDGNPAGYSYNIPDDNTDPDGLLALFQQPDYSLPVNALSGLLQHEVIIIKSCFPASDIRSEQELEIRKLWYLSIRDAMDRYPGKIFIVVTQSPLNPAETNLETAARARVIANWLRSDEFLTGHPNVATFDFFDLLAESDPAAPDANMLKAEYRQGRDSHPNELANQAIGPLFVDFVINAIEQ